MSGKLRPTLVGLSVGAAIFLGLGLYMNRATGFGILDHPGPLGVLTLVGATVGGLVGPLLAGLIRRRLGTDREETGD